MAFRCPSYSQFLLASDESVSCSECDVTGPAVEATPELFHCDYLPRWVRECEAMPKPWVGNRL